MPTEKLEPVKPPENEQERCARVRSVWLTNKLLYWLECYAYSTRSHMPAGLDYTEFSNALNMVMNFCNARPDWIADAHDHVGSERERTNMLQMDKWLKERGVIII